VSYSNKFLVTYKITDPIFFKSFKLAEAKFLVHGVFSLFSLNWTISPNELLQSMQKTDAQVR